MMRVVYTPLNQAEEAIVSSVIGCAISVHRELGPGFREFIYHEALCLELESRSLRFEREKKIAVRYRDWMIPGQRIDLIVEGVVAVETKAVPRLRPIHRQQVLSYLKTLGLHVGLILNFNVPVLKAGIGRVVL
jgi:GxxExxY protein